jgi:hypothetical protein
MSKSKQIKKNMDNLTNQPAVKTGEWFITFLISAIPIVGFIMLLVWAFGSGTNESKANWAKAALLWFVVAFAISTLLFMMFGAALFSAFS